MPPMRFITLPATSGAVIGVALPSGDILPLHTVIGIGRNYAEHAREQDAAVPERPLIFTKNAASIVRHDEDIVIPRVCAKADQEVLPDDRFPAGSQVDYEGELAIVIGAPIRDGDEHGIAASDGPLLGVCCANDVSARWWQKQGSGGQFVRGKSFDTFCPLGPDLVPLADAPPLDAITIETRLNGEVMQQDSTASMMFPVPKLIADLSRGTTLLPGTVILTGTPSGVGMAQTPPRYLVDGDVVEIELGGVGTLRNCVRQA